MNYTRYSYTHNGPICNRCGARYVGTHHCSREDIAKKIRELLDYLTGIEEHQIQPRQPYDTSGCPCRPENGGSGACGCILNNPIVN